MMKRDYLNEIRKLLGDYEISQAEINDIVADYDRMYEDGLAKGMNDDEVIAFLGKPEKIVRELGDTYPRKFNGHGHHRHNSKLIALTPFIATITYFILGMAFGLWHPGWLVFLLIPVTAIIVNGRQSFIATLTALSPFIAVVTFFLLGATIGVWHPAWLIFLIIPMIGSLNKPLKWQNIVFSISLLIAIGGYLYAGYALGEWGYGALAFLLPLIVGAAFGLEVTIRDWRNLDTKGWTRAEKWFRVGMILVIGGAIAGYLALGFYADGWGVAWLLFFAIPVYAIVGKAGKKSRLVALSPFLATTVFYLLGWFLGWWAYSWLAFLMIPIIAILQGNR
ncbi:MAG: DUF1700 domain-containing protein [bacterium]